MAETSNNARVGKSPRIHLRIESNRKALGPFREFCSRVLCRAAFDEDDCHWVIAAVLEAVSNAVIHGNGERCGTHVDVSFELSSASVRVIVVDEGGGFDVDSLPDPLSEERVLSTSGRGVYMMRRLMDEVRFGFPEGGGTAVTLVKSLRAAKQRRPRRAVSTG